MPITKKGDCARAALRNKLGRAILHEPNYAFYYSTEMYVGKRSQKETQNRKQLKRRAKRFQKDGPDDTVAEWAGRYQDTGKFRKSVKMPDLDAALEEQRLRLARKRPTKESDDE